MFDPSLEKLRIVTRVPLNVKQAGQQNSGKKVLWPLTLMALMSIMRHPEIRAWRDRQKEKDRGIAQSGSAPALGAGCREFESLYPDQKINLVTMEMWLVIDIIT